MSLFKLHFLMLLTLINILVLARQPPPPVGPGPPHSRGFPITHNDAPHSVALLWTIDQPVAETSTSQTQHSQHAPRWDSNPQSQQASGCRPSPLTARPTGTGLLIYYENIIYILRNLPLL
jgi:hypothetical protein